MSRVKLVILILGIMGLVFGAIGVGDAIAVMKEDFVEIGSAEKGGLIVGDLAKGNICFAYDQVAIETTTRRYGFIPMGSSETPYYLVAVNDHFGVLSCGNEEVKKKLDTLADKTWNWLDGKTEKEPEPVEVTTKVIAMPDKVKQYLHDYCKEWGMTEDDYLKTVDESVVINYVQYDSLKMIPFIGFGAGGLFIVIFIVMLIAGKKKSYGKTVYVGEEPPTFSNDQ